MYFGIKMFPLLILPLFLANVTQHIASPQFELRPALPIDPDLLKINHRLIHYE
jgi:hypothetical protein